METWVDHEMRNWARYCNLGTSPIPREPGSFLETWIIPEPCAADADPHRPAPIHEENAKRVQKVYDVAAAIEKRVLQAEYLSPARYSRFKGPQAAAAALKIPFSTYESALKNTMRRVERAFA